MLGCAQHSESCRLRELTTATSWKRSASQDCWPDRPDGSIRLLVPMAVVDELDRLKQGRNPTRAGVPATTAVLHRILHTDPPSPRRCTQETLAVTVELRPDPHGHRRLRSADEDKPEPTQ
jgi:hypothetical protein